MNFSVFSTTRNTHYQHFDSPESVQLLDDSGNKLGITMPVKGSDYDCAESPSQKLIAIGYWETADLEIFNLDTGHSVHKVSRRRISCPLFDLSGTNLLFQTGSTTVILSLRSGQANQIKGIRSIKAPVLNKKSNSLILPSQKRGELLSLNMETGVVTMLQTQINSTFYDLKQRPNKDQLIAIDTKKRVHCIDMHTNKVVWTTSIQKSIDVRHVGVGQFCGDGTLFGAAATTTHGNLTIVINSETGAIERQLPTLCYGLPLRSTIVRDQSTLPNSLMARCLDLSNGNISEELIFS
jgi:hypothetical protein